MSDRFKFRVWAKPHEPTKTEGYYVNDADYIAMTPDGKVQIEYYYDNGYSGYIDSFEQDEVIVEQCTGLKDKKGNLIYEGDIIEDDNTKSDTGVVVWSRAGFKVKMFRYNQIVNIKKNIRVVGNIHEEQSDE